MKVTNLPIPAKKGSTSQSIKLRFAKKGDDSSETCSDIVPFEGSLPPRGNIVLESSHPPSAHARSSRRHSASKSRSTVPRPSTDAPPSSRTRGSKRKTSPSPLSFVCHL